jgi:hypothetical protein
MNCARSIAILLFLASPVAAQNSDLGFLFGVSSSSYSINNSLTSSAQMSVQVNYVWQLREGPAGRLYVEIPIAPQAGSNAQIGQALRATAGGAVFVVPGIRFHRNISPRLAFYAAAGAGFVYGYRNTSLISGRDVTSFNQSTTGFATNVGGGLDFRLTRLWSLRGELRNFISTNQNAAPRNNVNLQFGFALHF